QPVGTDGQFSIPPEVLKKAEVVAFGAPDKEDLAAEGAVRFPTREFVLSAESGTLALAEGIWSRFRFHWRCVSGSVRVCRRRPVWFEALLTAAVQPALAIRSRGTGRAAP